MNGSAPNSPATGSQFVVRQKPKPNFCSDSDDSLVSRTPIAMTMSSSAAAKTPMLMRNPVSVERTRRLGYLDPAQRSLFERDDVRGERGVPEISAVFLAVGQRPLHEIDHRFGGRLVLRLLVEEHPRE